MSTAPNLLVERYVSFRENAIIEYQRRTNFSKPQSEKQLENLEKGKKGEYNGYISPATQRNIKKMLSAWLLTIKHSTKAKLQKKLPTFVTLTLPATQKHTDNEIKKLALTPFLDNIKKTTNCRQYFWKAEPQANGNIHFHVVMDCYVHWSLIRLKWNKRMKELGYIARYQANRREFFRDGFRMSNNKHDKRDKEKQLAAYKKGVASNWENPNTVDIHRVRNVKKVCAYVAKYMAKSDNDRRKIGGRLWGATDGVKRAKLFECFLSVEGIAEKRISTFLGTIAKLKKIAKSIKDDFFSIDIVTETVESLLKRHSKELYGEYIAHYEAMFEVVEGNVKDVVEKVAEIVEEKKEVVKQKARQIELRLTLQNTLVPT